MSASTPIPAPAVSLQGVLDARSAIARDVGRQPDGRWLAPFYPDPRDQHLGQDWLIQSARTASVWWVSPEMCTVIEAASLDVPSTRLTSAVLPDKGRSDGDANGIVFFGRPPMDCPKGMADESDVHSIPVHALAWRGVQEANGRQGMNIFSLSFVYRHGAERYVPGPMWTVTGLSGWRSGETPDAVSLLDCNRLLSMWLISTQTNIADRRQESSDRASIRRALRDGIDPSPMNVVRLRKRVSIHDDESLSVSEVDYSHRWIVGGHWRNQPYGSGRAQTRPTWIAPYVKGPQDKPLVIKETVKAVVR